MTGVIRLGITLKSNISFSRLSTYNLIIICGGTLHQNKCIVEGKEVNINHVLKFQNTSTYNHITNSDMI